MNNQPKPDAVAADLLTSALIDSCDGKKTLDEVAVKGFVQASLVVCTAQAMVNLLRQKNIISDHEISLALAHEYDAMRRRIRTSDIIVPAAPIVAAR